MIQDKGPTRNGRALFCYITVTFDSIKFINNRSIFDRLRASNSAKRKDSIMHRNCDICAREGITRTATVDTKMHNGPWAYLCDAHNTEYGCGIEALTNILSEIPEW